MNRILIFIIISIPIIVISWKTLHKIKSHGFYRFFSWECIAWLFVTNYKYWIDHPFSFTQLLSWSLLLLSGYLIMASVFLLKKEGKQEKDNSREALFLRLKRQLK